MNNIENHHLKRIQSIIVAWENHVYTTSVALSEIQNEIKKYETNLNPKPKSR